ncbi:MAG: type II toxin-antitoxin system VapC family toxin [Betaproteobacteria bacterium]|nr:type II toxin-antitoxin system VapC family toxin [Betaproteobacteria bacterium]
MADKPFYLLDTHIWFWLVRGREGQLAADTAAKLDQAALHAPLGVSVISVWEIALSASKGRIGLGMPVQDWIQSALDRPGFVVADLTPGIAVESCNLPGTFHADPADRFLVATARARNAVLVTRDTRILKYGKQGHVRTMAA